MSGDIEQLKKLLKAEFRSDRFLKEALTHRSYAVENGIQYDNQRLEFLGDAVLEIILTEYLFHRYPDADEGKLTRMRSGLVQESALATLARSMSLGSLLLTGKGEREANGQERDSTLADLFEAVIGAFYLEGGFESVRPFLLGLVQELFPDPENMLHDINPKGALQELSQSRWNKQPVYRVVNISGPEHRPVYEVEVSLLDFTAAGKAAGRKAAETQAARQMLTFLKNQSAGAEA